MAFFVPSETLRSCQLYWPFFMKGSRCCKSRYRCKNAVSPPSAHLLASSPRILHTLALLPPLSAKICLYLNKVAGSTSSLAIFDFTTSGMITWKYSDFPATAPADSVCRATSPWWLHVASLGGGGALARHGGCGACTSAAPVGICALPAGSDHSGPGALTCQPMASCSHSGCPCCCVAPLQPCCCGGVLSSHGGCGCDMSACRPVACCCRGGVCSLLPFIAAVVGGGPGTLCLAETDALTLGTAS